MAGLGISKNGEEVKYEGEVGEVKHMFTHLKLRMWVQRFCISVGDGDGDGDAKREGTEGRKWVERGRMDEETLSTGMRRCWGVFAGETKS